MTKTTKPQFTVRPTAYRAWDGRKMVDVQTLCWNAGGAIWYGAGNQMGWAWINPEYKAWTADNPKPGEGDIYPVMQWTGLKTKEGKDVWEGDIVKARENWLVSIHEDPRWHIGIVNYNGNAFQIDSESQRYVTFEDCEVIGNVFQNTELLET